MSGPPRPVCRGDTLSGQDWFDVWDNDACYNTYYSFIYTKDNGTVGFNERTWNEAQNDFVDIFNKYLSTNNITIPGATKYNVFQEVLLKSCVLLPGACKKAATQFCHGKPRKEISENGGLLDYCGCFAPPPTSDSIQEFLKNDPQCDPLCSRINTIPLDDGKGNAVQCEKNVCVMNDISIQATKTDIKSNEINFDQVCNKCQDDGCICIASGINVSKTLLDAGVTENFSQFCGKSSECLEVQPNGVDKAVNCQNAVDNQKTNGGTTGGTTGDSQSSGRVIAIIAIAVFVVILLLVIFFVFERERKYKKSKLKPVVIHKI